MRSIPKFRPSSSDTEFLVSLLVIIARFTRILCGGGCSHAIHFLGVLINLPVYHVFLASIAGFLTWLPSGAFFWIISHDFTLLQVVFRAMHKSCFPSGWMIILISYISFVVLSAASLLGVGWQCGYSSLLVPDVTITVGIFPYNFLNMFLLCRLVQWFTLFRTYWKSICRFYFQIPTLRGRNSWPIHLVRCEAESCWALLCPYYCYRLTQETTTGSFLYQWVLPQISWREPCEVSVCFVAWWGALHASVLTPH